MAKHFDCKCHERKKPVEERAWVVTVRRWNYGAFEPKGGSYSKYSTVWCLECGAAGRTKANYVHRLQDMTHEAAGEESYKRYRLRQSRD